ncbi:ABC transporter permease [Bradyrhizobium mercantei]|uniref:ABC transporter permease n=1 Tax=Bradyrhizobium mercantei TaxID=1904807 RepID=UPI001FD963DF|nr:ABC transporter permease [Bradyrhizobium mercantei]
MTVSNEPAVFVSVASAPSTSKGGYSFGPAVLERVMTIVSPIMLLVVWELCGRAGLLDQRYFPIPSTIFQALKALAVSGELWSNTEASLQRLAIGFFVGGVPALLIGVAMGLSRPLRLIVDPLIAATYPIPKSAILPLLLLIFGLGEGSKIAMVAIGVFYPVAINTLAGVLAINKVYFEVGTHFKATPWQTFRTIALPGALPFIMTGVKLGAGLGLVLIALAEMVGAKKGLGYMIWNSWELLAVDTMYAGILVIAVIGFALTILFNEIERIVVPWATSR